MAKPRKGEVGGRLVFDDKAERELPSLAVFALSDDGQTLASAPVDEDGTFAINQDVVAKARRITVGPADADPTDDTHTVVYRPSTFQRLIDDGLVALGPKDWGKFLGIRRCIDATIEKCWLSWPVVSGLIGHATIRHLGGPVLHPQIDSLVIPRFRCAPICDGVVEVYRRTCCCRPPIFEPPVLDPTWPDWPIPDPWPWPWPDPIPDPFPGPLPGPGPDPVPFDVTESVLTGGAIDVRKINVPRDRVALATLQGLERHEYLVARPYLWCTCSAPVKVGQGFVGEDGAIHVCWREPLRFLGTRCHDEFAFVVKQNIGGTTVTIYDGVAAGQWFESDDDIHLTTYHHAAIGCGGGGFPVPPGGPFVVLQDIGATESHQLRTPMPDGPDSVNTPGSNGGELSIGSTDYALGGTLQLRYHFSESMRTIGAAYYRVQVARANANGDPVGGWSTVPAPAWDTWRSTGTTIERGSHALGPNTVGLTPDLHHIPFDTGGVLGANEEWQDGQFHAVLDTTKLAHDRHLVRIEVFDAGGNRLEPLPAGFTYRRWINPTDTDPITYGAMTHLIRTENRPVVGDIVDVVGPGAGAGDCKFFTGFGSQSVSIDVDAYQPSSGPSNYLLSWSLDVRRGINGGSAVTPVGSTTEVGEGVQHFVSFSIADLLDSEAKCSFTANLAVYARIHNGSSRLTGYDRHDQASFAVERIQLPFPPLP